MPYSKLNNTLPVLTSPKYTPAP
jgi:hypothetical protein